MRFPASAVALTFSFTTLIFGALAADRPAATAARPLANETGVEASAGNMTLDQAVALALKQNPAILRAIQQIELTRGQIIQVRGQALPHLGINSQFNQIDRNLIESAGGGGGTDKSWEVNFQVNQVVYAGGQIRAALNIAKFTNDSSYFSLRDTVDNTIATVRQNFYTVLLNRELIQVQEESVKLLASQLKDQQNRFEAGTVPRFNVLQAEVALANQQPILISARGEYFLSLSQLAKTLSLDPGPQGRATFNPVGDLSVVERSLGLRNAIDLALENRPFLKVQRLNILTQKEQVKIALAGYQPRVDALAGWQVRKSNLTNQIDETVDGWFFGFTGNWNIFDGLETYGAVKAARASLEQAKINYDDSVHQVELEVQQAYVKLQTARATIRSGQKTVEQANEALRLASERLAAGAGTQLDVLNAQVQLTTARSTELQARADYNVALADYDRVTATATKYAETFDDPMTRTKKPKMPPVKNPPAAPRTVADPKKTR
jgi:outer membrane protein TolC